MDIEFTSLLISIRAWKADAGFYPVEAELEGDGSHYESGQLRLNTQSLLANELNAEAYGVELFNALFTGPIRTAYDVATGRASGTDGRLRVRLRIDAGAAELHAIPWERLYRVGGAVMLPLATADQTPFSRYTSLSIPEREPVAERPIKMLAALANPTGLPGGLQPANIDVEIQNLRRALGEMLKSGKLEVSLLVGRSALAPELLTQLKSEGYQILEGATTLDNIVRYLPGQHIFHFIGHGSFNRKTEHGPGQAALHLEKDNGGWKPEKDDDIVKRFAAIGALPHLVFLVACESASRDSKGEDAFVGLGPKLVQAGFPAVVAMQAQVPVETARRLSGEFYRRLMEHGVVDKAMSQARLLVFDPKRTEWSIPVLFMRLRNGRLFDRAATDTVSQMRRFEAAMPKVSPVKQDTFVRVMIAREGSDGLRGLLNLGDDLEEIRPKDVFSNPVPVDFPVQASTGRPMPVDLFIAVRAMDFDIDRPVRRITVPPDRDSGMVSFLLRPRHTQPRACIEVELYRDEKLSALLGSISLCTRAVDPGERVVRAVWQWATLPLTMAIAHRAAPMLDGGGGINIGMAADFSIGGDAVGRDATPPSLGDIHVGDIKNVTGVAIGHGAQATVTQGDISSDPVAQAFNPILERVSAMPAGEARDDARDAVMMLEDEARKGDGADAKRILRWMAILAETSLEAWELALQVLAHPIPGVGTVFQKSIVKAREDRGDVGARK